MKSLCDLSPKTSVSQTTYTSGAPTYRRTSPAGKYILLKQVAVQPDGTFISTGYLKVSINGTPVTSSGNNTEVQLVAGFSIDFETADLVYVEPNSSVDVDCRMSSGTGTVQIQVTGIELTQEEFDKLYKKYTTA